MAEPGDDETAMRTCASCGETCDVPISVPLESPVMCEECEASYGG